MILKYVETVYAFHSIYAGYPLPTTLCRLPEEWSRPVPILHLAPRTGISVAQLYEINGSVKLGAPALRVDFANARIDLHKRSRPQKGIESEVLQPNVAVLAVFDIQMLNQGDGDLAPQFNDTRYQAGVVDIERAVEAYRE